MTQREIGASIRKYRTGHGIPAKAVEIDMGVGRGRLSDWERGKCSMSLNTFVELCHVLGCSPSEILGF